jgi:hypothetical protein
MPYIAETDELIFDDEERAWVMKSPKGFEHICEQHSLRGKVCYGSVASRLRGLLEYERMKKLIPAKAEIKPVAPINHIAYANLHVSLKFNKDTQTYSPVNFLARKKGRGKNEYKEITIQDFVWNDMKHSDRINIQGHLWRLE